MSSRAVAAAGAVLAVILVAAAFIARPRASSPVPTDQSTTPVVRHPKFPAPPLGAVVFSRELGADTLALGVVPQQGHVLAQVSVVGPQGVGVPGLAVQINGEPAAECGEGCYHTTLARAPATVEVRVRSTSWRVPLAASSWPPRDGSVLAERAGRAWRSLHSLTYNESLASNARHRVLSTWRIQAPGRIAYQVQGGWAGIVVGNRRWDRPPNSGRWKESQQSPLTQPVPFWQSVADAHVLGTATMHGRPAWIVSFFDPDTPAWFTIAIDRKTLYTLDLRMNTTAHFMHDVYGSFNTTPPIRPPR
jgi:hypothetical protein